MLKKPVFARVFCLWREMFVKGNIVDYNVIEVEGSG